ncbi:MAG: hypothetical protein AB1778_05490 [Candidatus Bipolaricaulota bacterium]
MYPRRWGRWTLLVLVLITASGCGPHKEAPKYIFGVASVDSLLVEVADDQGVRVSIVIKGTLRDGCTEIEAVKQAVEDRVITLTVATRRPLDAVCEPGEVPFTQIVPLSSLRTLRTGDYTLVAGDATTLLRFERGGVAPHI